MWVGGGAERITRTPAAPQLHLAPELGSRIFEHNGTIRLWKWFLKPTLEEAEPLD